MKPGDRLSKQAFDLYLQTVLAIQAGTASLLPTPPKKPRGFNRTIYVGDPNLWNEFTRRCAERHISQSQALMQAIRGWMS